MERREEIREMLENGAALWANDVRWLLDRLETAECALREIAEVEPGKLAAARMEARANRALEELGDEAHADRR